MGRKARVDLRARRSLSQFLLLLRSKPVCDWPPPLSEAWKILNSELELPPGKALSIVLNSAAAAHQCVKAQNLQLTDLARAQARAKIQKACKRISNGISRAPAALRRRLDQAMLPLIQVSAVDLEVIKSIFEVSTTIFEEFADSNSSSTALRALRELRAAPFSTLGMAVRREVEKAIVGLVAASSNAKIEPSAATVFATMADALGSDKTEKLSAQSSRAITSYVADLAEIWRRAGQKPSRVIIFSMEFRSKFHRFADLVLTAMADPRADSRQELVSSRQELVSDDDVKAALRL